MDGVHCGMYLAALGYGRREAVRCITGWKKSYLSISSAFSYDSLPLPFIYRAITFPCLLSYQHQCNRSFEMHTFLLAPDDRFSIKPVLSHQVRLSRSQPRNALQLILILSASLNLQTELLRPFAGLIASENRYGDRFDCMRTQSQAIMRIWRLC